MKNKLLTVLLAAGLVFSAAGCETTNITPNQNQGGDQKTLQGIAVTANPTKAAYEVGEQFASAGLVVTATYSDQSSEAVTGYTLDPQEGYTFVEADIGQKQFTVTYQQKTASFSVAVTAATPVEEVVVEFDFTQIYSNVTGNDNVEFSTTSKNGVTISASKSDGTSTPSYYANGASLRLYTGNKLFVEGQNVTKIEVTQADNAGKKLATVSTNSGQFVNNVWTGNSASVAFTFGTASTGENGQYRISKIKVTLNGEGGDPVDPPVGNEWSADIKSALLNVVGELIPFIQLANPQVSTDEDEEGPYVYICDDNGQNQVEAYKELLAESGYDPAGDEYDDDYDYTAYFYAKEIDHLDGEEKREIMVQIDYFPGNSSYDSSFEIYAWIKVTYPSLTEWTEDDVDLMMEHLGEELPFAEGIFITLDYWTYDDETNQLSLVSYLDEDGVDAYIEELEKTFDPVDGQEGYYIKNAENPAYYLIVYAAYDFYYDDETGDFGYYANIYAFLQMIPMVTDNWPAEQIASYLPEGTTAVPSFDGLEEYSFTNDNGFVVQLGNITEEQENAYVNKLIAANYWVNYVDYEEYGYDGGYYQAVSWLEDVLVYLDDSEGIFDWTIYIYESSANYEEIVENFPQELVLSVLDGVAAVPSFVSSVGYKIVDAEDTYVSLEGIVNNAETYKVTFQEALEGAGYVVTEDEGAYTAKNEDDLVKIEYYFVGNYIEVKYSAYLATGEIITLTSADVPTKYDDSEAEHTMQGLKFATTSVMNQSNKIQFKKNVGVLRNAEAFDSIAYIKLVDANKTATDETLKMEAGTSADNLTEITATQDGSDLIYELDGATFFKLSNCGTGVFTCSSIEIAFAK